MRMLSPCPAGPLLSNLDATVTNANATLDAIREPLTKDLAEMEKALQDARALLASVQDVVRNNGADVAETVRALHAAAESRTLSGPSWSVSWDARHQQAVGGFT
jgi:ABC-type transporter Mla subunit MlaD